MQSCGNLERRQQSSLVDIPHENCQEITAIIREQRYSFIRTGDENLKAKQPVWHIQYLTIHIIRVTLNTDFLTPCNDPSFTLMPLNGSS